MSRSTGAYESIFDPTKYRGGIPADSGAPLIAKDVSVYGVLKPGLDIEESGVLIWNVYRGYNSITVCSVSDANTSSKPTLSLPFWNSPEMMVIVGDYTQPVLEPYLKQLDISPSLADTLSMGRSSVGYLKIYSATTSTTMAALNGQLAASAVTDLRNLQSYQPPDMVQNACTTKDGIANVKASAGVVSIIGCDIRDNLMPIDANYARTPGSAAYSSLLTPTTSGLRATLAGGAASTPCNFAYFVGANGVKVETTHVTTVAQIGTFYPGSAIRIRVNLVGLTGSLITNSADVQIKATAVFNSRQGDGQAVTTYKSVLSAMVLDASVGTQSRSPWIEFETLGGTQWQTLVGVALEFRTYYTNAFTSTNVLGVALTSVDVEMDNYYNLDSIGGFRVMRWDNITPTQTLNLEGKIQVDGIPTGAIAPYVKGSAKIGLGQPGFIYALRSLFSSASTALARVYTWDHYEVMRKSATEDKAIVNKLASYYNVSPSQDAAGMYGSASGMYGVHNAGLFSDLGSHLGSLAGSTLDDVFGAFGASTNKRPRVEFQTPDDRQARRESSNSMNV